MKLRKLIPTLLLIVNITHNLYPQDTNIVKYFPLKVGNVWIYRHEYNMPPFTGKTRAEIINSFTANGKTYFSYQIIFVPNNMYCGGNPFNTASNPFRIDSLTGNIYSYTPNQGCPNSPNERMYDSLKAKLHDSASIQCGQYTTHCLDTSAINIFGGFRPTKSFTAEFFEGALIRRYSKGIGLINSNFNLVQNRCDFTLLGCIIDGIVYGDTSMILGVQPISNEVPAEFQLYQNYPNPFNPVTRIKFDISSPSPPSKGEVVSLKIFDVLGREVATLVNEELKPGLYEIEWDGTNYPSGVYFYQLSIVNEQLSIEYRDTKKMVLIK